jgi:hypothetical protein
VRKHVSGKNEGRNGGIIAWAAAFRQPCRRRFQRRRRSIREGGPAIARKKEPGGSFLPPGVMIW